MARPTKLSPALQDRILLLLRAGNYIETAAAAAGVTKTTLYDWLKRGAREKAGPYVAFSAGVEQALAQAEANDLTCVGRAAAEGQWQAAAWRLERKFPQRWGRRDRVTLIQQAAEEVKNLTDAELLAILAGVDDPAATGAGGGAAPGPERTAGSSE